MRNKEDCFMISYIIMIKLSDSITDNNVSEVAILN